MTLVPVPLKPEPSALLDLLSSAALKTIAGQLGLKPDGNTRPAAYAAVVEAMGTPHHREALERRLSQDDWDLLSLLALRSGSFTLQPFISRLRERGLGDREVYQRVLSLLACGCLLPLQTVWGNSKLGIDLETITRLSHLRWTLAPGVAGWAREHVSSMALPKPVEPPAALAGSTLPELQRAIFILLAELERKSLRFTAQGTPYKTDMPRLVAALSPGAAHGAKRRAGAEVPPLLYFALGALLGAGLLTDTGAELLPSDDGARFFRLPPEQQAQSLFLGWCVSYFNDLERVPTLNVGYYGYYGTDEIPWLRNSSAYGLTHEQLSVARAFIGQAIAEVTAPDPDAWYAIDDLSTFAFEQDAEFLFTRSNPHENLYSLNLYAYANRDQPQRQRLLYPAISRRGEQEPGTPRVYSRDDQLYMDTDWREVEGALVRQALRESLRWLGLVEVGPDADHPDRFRLTELGKHLLLGKPLEQTEPVSVGRAAIVQPNFEIVVTDATHSFALLAQLDAFAERRSLDRAATYQLTRAALVRGLDRGWIGKEILETLETANDGPLPQSVRFSIEEWIALYEQLSLREAATLLEADNAEALEGWLADPVLAALLGERLGPTALLVPAGNAVRVASRIAKLGRLQGADRLVQIDYAQPLEKALHLPEPDVIEIKPELTEPYLRYRVEAFAEPLVETDRAGRYRITRESVRLAAEAGWSGDRIALFLVKASGEDLPDELLVQLLGWSGLLPPLQTELLVAVALPAKPIGWETLLQIPSIAPLIRAVPAPELALVAPDDLPALQAELAERGLALQESRIEQARLRPESIDLVSLLKQNRDEPQAVHDALKRAGLLGRLDQIRWGY